MLWRGDGSTPAPQPEMRVEITTPQLAGSVEFYSKVWGLDVVAEAEGTVYLAATGSDFHVLELNRAL